MRDEPLLQDEMSTCLSLLQCRARLWKYLVKYFYAPKYFYLWQVWSVRREQDPRLSWLMLGQFQANTRRAWSPTAWNRERGIRKQFSQTELTSLQIWATVHCWSNSSTILAILPPEARQRIFIKNQPGIHQD